MGKFKSSLFFNDFMWEVISPFVDNGELLTITIETFFQKYLFCLSNTIFKQEQSKICITKYCMVRYTRILALTYN
jgi:hypothetical protein